MTMSSFSLQKRWHNLLCLFLIAILIRSLVFAFYIAPHEFYLQPDSRDYHYCACSLAAGHGMAHPDNLYPTFWRTPGYPLYLTIFYRIFGVQSLDFLKNKKQLEASIWVQILLCSLLPVLLFFLALHLTASSLLAWCVAWISVFHLGFVLATNYILSDALASLLLMIFFLFFYRITRFIGEPRMRGIHYNASVMNICGAAFFLGLYTWLRPNGQFTVFVAAGMLLLTALSWKVKMRTVFLFLLTFFIVIGGWYIRNYRLTGHWFFCPMTGAYVQTFCAPKIVRSLTGRPLIECMNYVLQHVGAALKQEYQRVKTETPHLYLSRELVCGKVAWPIIFAHPFYFVRDWIKEVLKTTFDPYASQLVAFANNTYSYDPPEEFLFEKLYLCLFGQPMPIFSRLLCWIDFLFLVWVWIGLLGGLWLFLIKPLFRREISNELRFYRALWLKTGIFVGGLVVLTGGFGYARLRMPVEPLVLIMTLTWWLRFLDKKPTLKFETGK